MLGHQLEEKYGVPVALVSCRELDGEDIGNILEMVLGEFPITEVEILMPEWTKELPETHPIKTTVLEKVRECAAHASKMGAVREAYSPLSNIEFVNSADVTELDLGKGKAQIELELDEELFYKTLGELSGLSVSCESDLLPLLCELSQIKAKYNKVEKALNDAEERGYGIVMPDISELHLEEPEIVRKQGGYGVKLSASAQSIHMIRANIETEINPMVGSEQQSEELVKYLLR